MLSSSGVDELNYFDFDNRARPLSLNEIIENRNLVTMKVAGCVR